MDQKYDGSNILKKQAKIFVQNYFGSEQLLAEREVCVRIATPRTAALLRRIYNSHFNQCQEDTELLMNHFSTAVNRLG